MDSTIDEYKQNLIEATRKLKECQKNLNLRSCFNCEKLFDCKTRKEYIDAVYKSMSKGQSGGFEF